MSDVPNPGHDDPDASAVLLVIRIVIGVVSVVGNGILLAVFIKFKGFRSQFSNCLISMLASADFMIGFGLLIRAAYSIFGGHVPGTGYNRIHCALMGIPPVFGIISGQIMYCSMALDRLMAVRMKARYGALGFKLRISAIVGAWMTTSLGVFALLFGTMPSTPSRQCSTGALGSRIFLYFFICAALGIAVLVFTIYGLAIKSLKEKGIGEKTFKNSQSASIQQRVFRSLSVLLSCYFTFCVLPMIAALTILQLGLPPETLEDTLGYLSIAISLSTDFNSCLGIFIYFFRHEEIKKHIRILAGFSAKNSVIGGGVTVVQSKRIQQSSIL